jgi:Putative adhesin
MATFAFWRNMNRHAKRFPSLLWAGPLAAVLVVVLPTGASPQTQPEAGEGVDRLTVHLSDPTRPGTVKVNLLNGSISVKSYEGNDIKIEAHSGDAGPLHDEEPPRPGMHHFSVGTTGLTADEQNNEVNVTTDSILRSVEVTLTVPVHTSLSLRTVNGGGITVTGVDGDVDATVVNGPITLTDISGSAVAHTINGRLTATFTRLNESKPVAFSSMNGDIDVTFPPDVKATLNLRSQRGGVFSDFDVKFLNSSGEATTESPGTGRKYQMRIGGGVSATINGGGDAVQLINFNGNIYIHKAGGGR